MRALTIGEAADLLEELEPDLAGDYFLRQLRGFVQRGLIEPAGYRGVGRTAAALLGPMQLCAARLLSVLARLGLPPEQLRDALNCLRNFVPYPHPVLDKQDYDPAAHEQLASRPLGFEGAAEAILAGERWFFVIKVDAGPKGRDADLGGVRGGCVHERALGRRLAESPALAAMVLDCDSLFGPVLRHLAEPAEPLAESMPADGAG